MTVLHVPHSRAVTVLHMPHSRAVTVLHVPHSAYVWQVPETTFMAVGTAFSSFLDVSVLCVQESGSDFRIYNRAVTVLFIFVC